MTPRLPSKPRGKPGICLQRRQSNLRKVHFQKPESQTHRSGASLPNVTHCANLSRIEAHQTRTSGFCLRPQWTKPLTCRGAASAASFHFLSKGPVFGCPVVLLPLCCSNLFLSRFPQWRLTVPVGNCPPKETMS